MFFATQPTRYDLTFRLFGYEVRVNPTFFILPLVFARGAASSFGNVGVAAVLVALIFFVSILVHELGHSLAFSRFGVHSRILLYWMGGLAIPETGSWQSRKTSLNSNEKIFVSFAGPLAGFTLAFVLVLLGLALGGNMSIWFALGFIPVPSISFAASMFAGNPAVHLLINFGIILNIFLNLLNLMPVYPLDGGQIAREIFIQRDYRDGQRNSLYLSMAVAIGLAVMALFGKDTFMMIFFGMLAYNNYMMLQRPGGFRW